MNSDQIARALTRHPITSAAFRGVFPRDALKRQRLCANSLYIVNTDVASGPGEHWTVIATVTHKRGEPPIYFCPLGIPPIYKEIEQFLLSDRAKYFRYNAKPIQHYTSDTCGYFCIDAAIQLFRGLTLRAIRQRYQIASHRLIENDARVRVLLRKEKVHYPARQ